MTLYIGPILLTTIENNSCLDINNVININEFTNTKETLSPLYKEKIVFCALE